MAAPKKQRYYGLEWLRFLMAVWMVTFHFGGVYSDMPAWFSAVSSMAFFATSCFFMLSGFLLTHVSLDQNYQMKMPGPVFVVRRLCNLYPIHVIAMLFMLVLFWLVPDNPVQECFRCVTYNSHPYLPLSEEESKAYEQLMTWPETGLRVTMQMLLLHAWDPRFIWLNGPSWSISTLFFFYICFPWVAPRLMRLRYWVWGLVVIWLIYITLPALATLFKFYDYTTVGTLHRNPLLRLPEFLLGIMLYWVLRQPVLNDLIRRYRYLGLGIGLCGVLLGAWALNADPLHSFYLLHNGILLPFAGLLLLSATMFSAPKSAWVKNGLQRLGESSLSLFVFHLPLLGPCVLLTHAVLQYFFPGWEPGGGGSGTVEFAVPAWTMPFHLLILISLALLIQLYMVRRMRSWLEKWLLPRVKHWSASRQGRV